MAGRVALITGAAHRIGAAIARALHDHGMNVAVHYRSSRAAAERLQDELNAERADSAVLVQGDLHHTGALAGLVQGALSAWGRLDALINNASTFYQTPIGSVSEEDWDDLLGTNLKAPFFLSQAAAPYLQRHHGCIVNIADIHAERPRRAYPVYSIAKAGLVMLTKALASELGPEVRVNAVAPGAILWPEHEVDEETKRESIARTFLKRRGDPGDITRTVLFLIRDAGYMSGQVLTVDGGRSLGG
ncbi:MAG: pteridine reductase [Gammaproteobacteria bacterium]|nr:pteridine reductase [Gammaproteobacteria bacterium]NIR98622.1 pteridine reductase [Gammaproteobacteria bacterium]NIT64345.1 pteridine reductase [Gammaproteobacteria bacterium]NIV21269.1 pteridine reductase [Gammaproteobacteria bacterium]NIX10973.1 pteridine reductase [Gammaproteobacteria bacterium]